MDHSYVRKKVKNLSIEEKAFILAWNNSEKIPKDYPAWFSHSKSIINHYVKWVRKWINFFQNDYFAHLDPEIHSQWVQH